jgi:hypothetical protein
VSSPPITVATARAFVHLWRQSFPAAPASVCLTLMEIESSFIPTAHAIPSAEAIARGVPAAGAWGLLQLLPGTAADMVRRCQIAAMPAPVRDAISVWTPDHPECLTHPALGSLLGVAYLDHLAGRFGPGLDKLAAAYHNGPGFLAAFLAAGKSIPEDMPPKGQAYVIRARQVWPKYQHTDDAETPQPTPAPVVA